MARRYQPLLRRLFESVSNRARNLGRQLLQMRKKDNLVIQLLRTDNAELIPRADMGLFVKFIEAFKIFFLVGGCFPLAATLCAATPSYSAANAQAIADSSLRSEKPLVAASGGVAVSAASTNIALDTAAMDTAVFADTAKTADTATAKHIIDMASAARDTFFSDTAQIASDTVAFDTLSSDSTKIKNGLHFFASIGAQFINFNYRSKFQEKLNALFEENTESYKVDTAGLPQGEIPLGREIPQKQDFQKVNLAFPIMAGVFWQFNDLHSLAIGAGFLYDKESVVLSDKFGELTNLSYTLQAFPLFAEYRLQVSPDLISLANGDYFSVFFRWYWMLPHTEIYSYWGKAKAKLDPLGNGYGVYLGYRFWEWQNLSVWGELGFSDISVESNDELFGEKPDWNLGGITISIRFMF